MSANLSAVPKLQFFDNNGNPLVGGKLYTYAAGTTTPLATYTDATATTPNTNPIILDSRGEANVWLSATTYKFVLTDATDATIWTVDNISNSLSLSQILAASGSAASPPYTFASDTDTGMYLAAVGQLGLAVGGVPVIRSTSTILTIGQSGGSNDVDVTHYGDTAQTGNVTQTGNVIQTGNWTLTGDVNVTGAAVFNEAGADKDFRVEGDTNPNMLFVDASTDQVGIGTNTPTAQLHQYLASGTTLRKIENGSVRVDEYASTTVASAAYGTVSNHPLLFTTNNNERMRITSTGNVGIGTNNPTDKLFIAGTGAVYVATNNGTVNMVSGISAGNVGLMGTTTNHDLLLYANNAERGRFTGTGLFQFDSGYGSVATAYGCRAWINFDGTSGSIGSGRGSGNVSSVTDNGTGDYTINFSTAMPDANYAVTGVAKEYDSTTGSTVVFYLAEQTIANTLSTSFVRVHTATGGASTATDAVVVCVAVFR